MMNNYADAIKVIENYYGTKTTKRKAIPLIAHIYEGLEILQELDALAVVQEAFAIHPIIQGDDNVWSNAHLIKDVDPMAIILAMEYRKSANSYLPKPDNNGKVSTKDDIYVVCSQVSMMLIADKIQNYRSLLRHRPVDDKRHEELVKYFDDWFEYFMLDKEYWLKEDL